MKKSIQKVILSSLMILFSITTAMAQMVEVVPGSKGALPAPPAIAEAQEGHFGSLALKQVSLQSEYMFSYYRYYLETRLEFRPVSDFGGDSYTIQYHTANSDTWETVNDEQLWYNQYGEAWVEIDHDGSKAWPITYRLKLNGGPMDGWVSNEVVAEKPYKAIYAGIGYSEPNFIYAGLKVYSHYIDCKVIPAEEQKEKRWIDIPRGDVKVSYKWYLRNPNTYEMTKIEGATSGTYTPTTEQTGYELVSEVEGTYNNAYVKTQHSFGVIKLPILASLEYAGPDGFILNTDYILPDPENDLYVTLWDEEAQADVHKTFQGMIKTTQPGQYVVEGNIEEFMYYEMNYGSSPYQLSMWSRHWSGYHEFVLMQSETLPVRIKVLKGGEEVKNATVDILAKTLSGKIGVLSTATDTEGTGVINIDLPAGMPLLLKAHQTDGTIETYFPSSAIWNEAKALNFDSHDFWEKYGGEDFAFVIDLLPEPQALTGTSVITGTVSLGTSASRSRAQTLDASETITVLLKDKADGNIIAMTETDGSGNYRFENVPVGEYVVAPNIIGYKAEDSEQLETAVTQDNQTVYIDCALEETTEMPVAIGALPGDVNSDEKVDGTDVSLMIEYIMGEWVEGFSERNADVNKDQNIDAADLVRIINIINENNKQ